MKMLEDKVALITGAARGIGRAAAMKFAEEGATVALFDVCADLAPTEYEFAYHFSRPEDLARTAELVEERGGSALPIVGSVRSQADLDAAVAETLEAYGRIDACLANAGMADFRPFWEMSEEEWNDGVDINLTGAWRTAKAVAPEMISREQGSFVFTASVNALEAGTEFAHYVAAKHGVLGLMRTVALELGSYGIRANAVLPGPIDTRANDHPAGRNRIAGKEGATREDYLHAVRNWTALRGRTLLSPSVIANGMAWLSSDQAEHVTGVELVLDAGHRILPGINQNPVRDIPFSEEQLSGVPDSLLDNGGSER